MITNNPIMKWLIYGFGWLSLALTLPIILAMIASFLPFKAGSYLSDKRGLAFAFAGLPFACVRIAIWLRDKKVSLPRSLDGWCYPFIEFPVMVALVVLAVAALAGPFPLLVAGMPIALACAAVAAIAMVWCELPDWFQCLKGQDSRK